MTTDKKTNAKNVEMVVYVKKTYYALTKDMFLARYAEDFTEEQKERLWEKFIEEEVDDLKVENGEVYKDIDAEDCDDMEEIFEKPDVAEEDIDEMAANVRGGEEDDSHLPLQQLLSFSRLRFAGVGNDRE